MFDKCLGVVFSLSSFQFQDFFPPRIFPRNFDDMSKQFHETASECFWGCPISFRKMSRIYPQLSGEPGKMTCPKSVPDMARAFPGNLPEISGTAYGRRKITVLPPPSKLIHEKTRRHSTNFISLINFVCSSQSVVYPQNSRTYWASCACHNVLALLASWYQLLL